MSTTKVSTVTGGSGIGLAITKRFVCENIHSIIVGSDEQKLATAKELNNGPERKAKALGRTPMGVLGKSSDIGKAALFPASDAAKYITGVVLPVDGGNSTGF